MKTEEIIEREKSKYTLLDVTRELNNIVKRAKYNSSLTSEQITILIHGVQDIANKLILKA